MKISVIFEALTGSFDTDIQRSARLIDRETARMARNTAQRQAEMREQFARTGKAIGLFAAGVTASAVAIIKSQIEQIAKYQDLSDKIGDTAENIASLKAASDLSGVGFDTIAAASVKLTAALAKTDDESKGVGAALAAIGLELESFRTLAPIDQIEAVAEALADFRDGAGKTAIAVALFGKSGAELLPLFQDLADGAKRQTSLTQDQIIAVDELAKSLDRSKGALSGLAQEATASLAPSLKFLTDQLLDGSKKSDLLAASGDALLGILKGLSLAVIVASNAVQILGKSVFSVYQSIVGLIALDFDYLRAAAQEGGAGIEQDLNDILKSYEAFFGEVEAMARGADTRPEIDQTGLRNGTTGGGAGPRGSTEADRLLELSKALDAEAQSRRDAQKAIDDTIASLIEEQAIYGLSETQITMRSLALQGATDQQLEYARTLLASREAQAALTEAESAAARLYEETRTPLERLNSEIGRLNELRSATGRGGAPVLDEETYTRAIKAAQDEFEELSRKGEDATNSLSVFADEAARNMQSAFADFLFDPFDEGIRGMVRGFAQAVQRMAAEAIAAQLFEKLLPSGGGSGGGGGGSIFGSLFSLGASALAGGFGGGAAVPAGAISSDFTLAAGGGLFSNVLRDAGGYAKAGQPTMIGTGAQPEMFIPQTPGTFTPASDWMQPPQVNIRNINAFDTQAIGDYLATPDGEEVVLNIARRNSGAFRQLVRV